MGEEYDRAYIIYMRMARNALYIDNEPCAKAVINAPYWDALERVQKNEKEVGTGKYIFLGVAIGVIFVLALVLFIRYYQKQLGAPSTDGPSPASPPAAEEKPTEQTKQPD